MKTKTPKTRTEATAPRAVAHLSPGQQEALEKGDEAEHSHGPRRETLTKEAAKKGDAKR